MSSAVYIPADQLRRLTPWPRLIEALTRSFQRGCQMPERLRFDIGGRGSLLVMPAWTDGATLGIKLVQVFPGNSRLGKPSVHGTYTLLSAATGEVLAQIEAEELTTRRTAAASALASTFLSRRDSRKLLLMGAGRLAFDVACAHASVRALEEIHVWARRVEQAEALAARLKAGSQRVQVVRDLYRTIPQMDIISTVSTAHEPILPGALLSPGTHVDLIGGFRPDMREADDEVIRRAALFVDMRAAALREPGDIVGPIERGLIGPAHIRADLFELCDGAAGRRSAEEVTVFKSVGLALEDLAAASLAFESLRDGPTPL
jgi:ornithine cyclodeaminase